MELGLIGLGRMGINMVRRLMRAERGYCLMIGGEKVVIQRIGPNYSALGTITAAIDESVPSPVLSAALYERFSSRGEDSFADRLLSALRFQFGGHQEKTAGQKEGA